jgi:hypothetical protein
MEPIIKEINKGTGAGGAKTNVNGKAFENLTDNSERLINKGFVRTEMSKSKYGYYLSKEFDDKTVYYVTKSGLNTFVKKHMKSTVYREPDEAYIIKKNDTYEFKILEKKNQNTDGSVDLKLYAGIGLLKEYRQAFENNYTVSYAFCLSDYFKKKFRSDNMKYKIMQDIILENEIEIMYGKDEDYFEQLDKWVGIVTGI